MEKTTNKLIKTLSEIDIRDVRDVEIFFKYSEEIKSHEKLKELFEIFLENYKQSKEDPTEIMNTTHKAIQLLKKDSENDPDNLLKLEIAEKIISQLKKPSKKAQIQPYVKEIFIPFAAFLNIFAFFGITEKRIKETCLIDKGYFCHAVEFLLGTKQTIDTFTDKIPIDTLVLIILIFLLFIVIYFYRNKFLAAFELPLPGNSNPRLTIKNPEQQFKSKKKSTRKSLRKSLRKSIRKSLRKKHI
jgi:hypothetical protein